MLPGRLLWACIVIVHADAAQATAIDQEFRCHPAAASNHVPPTTLHGADPLTREHRDDVLWAIGTNRMNAAGSFILAEIGCGSGCIRLASVDARSGAVSWLPQTISNWPGRMLQPVRYRSDSRLVVVSGQLDERGPTGPFRFLLDGHGFHPVPEPDQRRAGRACPAASRRSAMRASRTNGSPSNR